MIEMEQDLDVAVTRPRRRRRSASPDAPARAAAAHRSAALEPLNSLLVHDIKNLSFRLGALLKNLDRNYEDPLFKRSVVEVIADTVQRMDGIVRRCRDRKDEVIIKIPVDLNEILHGVIESLPRAYRSRHDILIEEDYVRVPRMWGDPEFLREAFAILVQNGLEALGDRGGRLAIATGSMKTRSGRRRVIARIADNGCGMSREFVRRHLFVPFVTTKGDGLGMGLYACRKIVAVHHGSIQVFSREGRGTKFRLAFDAI